MTSRSELPWKASIADVDVPVAERAAVPELAPIAVGTQLH